MIVVKEAVKIRKFVLNFKIVNKFNFNNLVFISSKLEVFPSLPFKM